VATSEEINVSWVFLTQNDFLIKYGEVSNIVTLWNKIVSRVYSSMRVMGMPSLVRKYWGKTVIVAGLLPAGISRYEVAMSYKTRRGLQGHNVRVCSLPQCCDNLYFPRRAQTLQTCTLSQKKTVLEHFLNSNYIKGKNWTHTRSGPLR
jgi:hypothetical protein